MYRFSVLGGLCLLAACSGGSDSGTVNAPPPTPTLAVTLAPSTTSQTAAEDNSVASFTLTATYSGSASTAIVPVLSYDTKLLQLDGPVTQSGASFTAKFNALSGLPAQSYSSDVAFKLCTDTACGTTYPGSSQKFTYALEVKLSDWTTRQRNAAHNGYVHASFDPAKFALAWEFGPASGTNYVPVAANADSVFVTQSTATAWTILALNPADATVRWRYELGGESAASGPALAGDNLVVSHMGITSYGTSPMTMLDSKTGGFVTNFVFSSQWSSFVQPTTIGSDAYVASGYYGNQLYAFDLAKRVSAWTGTGTGNKIWDGEAPGADKNYAYYYSGKLDVFNRVDGTLVKTIQDPNWGIDNFGPIPGPVMVGDNNVIAFSQIGNSGKFPLASYDIAAGTVRWTSVNGYGFQPAWGKDAIYAANPTLRQLDAVDPATGKVLWSWPLPAQEFFAGNIVATDNLIFLSTETKTYAIAADGSHATLWSVARPGSLAITPRAQLIITPFNYYNAAGPRTISAYSLR